MKDVGIFSATDIYMGDNGGDTRKKQLEKLWKHRVFRDLDWNQMQAVGGFIDLHELDPGDYLTKQGATSGSFYFLLDGECAVLRKDPEDGDETQVATIRAGRIVGELSLFDSFPSSASVVAQKPATVVKMSRESLQKLEKKHAQLANKILWGMGKSLAQKLRKTTGTLTENILKSQHSQ